MKILSYLILVLSTLALPAVHSEVSESYLNFESHQFRPVAMSPSGELLFVTNTPDNRIEIFDLTGSAPRLIGEVMVGMEPVALAAPTDDEVWVVNHLSDSVSIVDIRTSPPR